MLKDDNYHVLTLAQNLFLVKIFKQDMGVIYLLLTVSIIVAIIFLGIFIYSVKSGQYDDTYTPSIRMLFEDELVKKNKKN